MEEQGGQLINTATSSVADILERILDKGVVIAGDIRIELADIELLTIRIRLLVASVDKAKEMGIDWWEHDSYLTSQPELKRLEKENKKLLGRVKKLETRNLLKK